MKSSISFWWMGFLPTSAGPMMVLTFATALDTPLPMYTLGSLSRSSSAS